MGFRVPGRSRRGTPADVLVVGLGNPGKQFAGTRHNVGADAVVALADRHGARLRSGKEQADSAEVTMDGQRVALAVPRTYMNESGLAVGALVRRYGVDDPAALVVVHDELDLSPGTVRVKAGGGLAGHNGLRSIRAHLHSADFVRVRLGVGKPPGRSEGADHVLSRPGKTDRELLAVAVQQAADAVEAIVADGVEAAMSEFNRRQPAQ